LGTGDILRITAGLHSAEEKPLLQPRPDECLVGRQLRNPATIVDRSGLMKAK